MTTIENKLKIQQAGINNALAMLRDARRLFLDRCPIAGFSRVLEVIKILEDLKEDVN